MKRSISVILTVLMLLGCMTPALAAAEPAEEGETLYQQYGPWSRWSQEAKDASDSWSQEEWDLYWTEYESWAWLPMEQYWDDYDTWQAEYYGWEEPDWTDYLLEEKIQLGMPYPDGRNVSLNGAYLDFGGARPVAEGGATLVPFTPLMEAAGATVVKGEGELTAQLPDGNTVRLAADSAQLEYTQGDKLCQAELGQLPKMVNGLLYIPVRPAAEALGLDVAWDASYDAVHLTDWAALEAEVDSHFTYMNELVAAAYAAYDPEQAYSLQSRAALEATLYGEEEHDTATFGFTAKGVSQGNSFSGSMALEADLGGMRDTIFGMVDEDTMAVLDSLNGGSLEVIYNDKDSALYLKGELLQLAGQMLVGDMFAEDSWVGISLPPMPVNTMEAFTIGQLLVGMQQQWSFVYRLSPWESVMNQVQPMRLMMDDANFTRTSAGSTVNYTMKLDLPTLAARASELGLTEDFSILDLLTGQMSLPQVDVKLNATVVDGKLDKISSHGEIELTKGVPISFVFDVDSTQDQASVVYALKGQYVGKVELVVESSQKPTSQKPLEAPPVPAEEIWWM